MHVKTIAKNLAKNRISAETSRKPNPKNVLHLVLRALIIIDTDLLKLL